MAKKMIINKTMNSGHFPFITSYNRNIKNGNVSMLIFLQALKFT